MPSYMLITSETGPVPVIKGGGITPKHTLSDHTDWLIVEKFSFGEGYFGPAMLAPKEAQPVPSFGTKMKVERLVDIASLDLMRWVQSGDKRSVQIDHTTQDGLVLYSLKLLDTVLVDYDVGREDEKSGIPEYLTLAWTHFELATAESGVDGKTATVGPQSPFKYTRPNAQVSDVTPAVDTPEAGTETDQALSQAATAQHTSEVADIHPSDPSTSMGANALLHSLTAEDSRAPAHQVNRRLEVDDINGKAFSLLSFQGSEGVSRLFEFTLELSSADDPDVQAADIVGQKVGFRIVDGDDIDSADASPNRNFHGRVRSFWAGEVNANGSRRYRIEVVPWMWMLTKRSDCRIFQQKSVIEIIEQVFSDASFSDFEKGSVLETYPKLDYCVQYRETDFDFVARLLEENGILYFFLHAADKHTLVLADDKTVHTMCEDKDVVHSGADQSRKRIYSWERRFEMVSKKTFLRDYNYLTPADNLQVEQPGSVSLPDNSNLELFDYPGAYTKKSEGDKIAKARIQAEEARYDVAVGRGNWDGLEVGRKFTFKDHEVQGEVDKVYVVARIDHRVDQFNDGRSPCVDYHSTFSCVPDSVLLRPPQTRERPRLHGPQTAIVVGPEGEEIETDKYGRIKVQFHWDRVGTKDENSSCWLRVAQPLAGKGWGALALPRIGQEVLVAFLDGDPDRPLVVGALYNETALPLDLPAKKNETLLRTRSTKEGTDENFNELRFDDTKDAEKIYLHAELDMERIVEHDDTLTVGKEGDGSRTVVIEKDSTLTINAGNRVETISEGNDTLTIEKGDRTIEVKTGNEVLTIKGDRTVTIQSGKDTLEVTAGDQSIKLGGKGEIEATSGFTIKVTGGTVTIDASPGIELKSGSSSIKLGPSGVEVKGMSVKIEGDIESQLKAAMVTVDGSGMCTVKGGITMIG